MSKRVEMPTSALLLACLLAAPGPALGHAAVVQAGTVEAVRIEGRYDSGEPMGGAQVTIYAPADPATPWQQGKADADGAFLFVPDHQPGRWAIQLRQAGHGGMAYVELTQEAAASVIVPTLPTSVPTPAQKTVMAACVVWGCIGTALYFRRTRAA